jgi:4-amino-4-deoxy-L-arabinose transferase-like glycosyltransferase
MTATTSPLTDTPAVASSPGARIAARLGSAGRWIVRGDARAARWERPALLGLLAATALLYLVNLTANGWANSFYSAAVQAGSVDWTAFFYGSSDAANSITVDKPPASLWLMALSVRLFGLSSMSILLPEALMGVATVAVLYATVRRRFSAPTALLAGGILAITPVAALMFRFNNPDALLVLLTTLAIYFTLRGVETGALKWVLWAGTMIGFAFLTKQLQAFLVLPVLAAVYLWAAPLRFRTRLWHAFAALAAVVVSAGWWVAIVELVPASMRPYIGGSQTNSFLELTFGYNGLGRLTGNETGSVTPGGGQGTSMWGQTGILRMFTGEIGGQIAWLLPAALVTGLIGIVVLRKLPRTSATRATLVLLGGSLLVTVLAFSFMAGIFHAYYTVAIAPLLAGTLAIGAGMLWARRDRLWSRITMAGLVLGTVAYAWVLLSLATDWLPWLKFVVVSLGLLGAVLLLVPTGAKWLRGAAVGVALTSVLLAPFAYTLETVSTSHSGSIVTAGPTVAGSGMGPGGAGGPGQAGGQGGPGAGAPGQVGPGQSATGQAATGQSATGQAGAATTGTLPGKSVAAGPGGGPGGAGGLLGSASVSTEMVALLTANSSQYTWVAAAIGSNGAAGYQLATGLPVMAVGGFNGSDPSPTLEQFKTLVAEGKIHYFIGGSLGMPNGGSSDSSAISAWVAATYSSTTVGTATVYDLTK